MARSLVAEQLLWAHVGGEGVLGKGGASWAPNSGEENWWFTMEGLAGPLRGHAFPCCSRAGSVPAILPAPLSPQALRARLSPCRPGL